MNVEQLISDAHELSVLLCRCFNQEKIYLAGHSWGSALGALTVKRYPELYHAYVGIGQIVNVREGERISYQWTLPETHQPARESGIEGQGLKELGVILRGGRRKDDPGELRRSRHSAAQARALAARSSLHHRPAPTSEHCSNVHEP
jgi:pimeloyl-ACP methyl ester carboxylesterase